MGTSPIFEQDDDPLTAYRAQKQQQQPDPLSAYRASRQRPPVARPQTLTDSLIALTGGKRPGGGVSPDAQDVGGGEYNPKTDELWTVPNASRGLLAHEYGHRYDEGPLSPPGGRLQGIVPASPTNGHEFGDQGGQAESNARAFAKAVGFLQDPVSRGPGAINALGAIEGQQPGTGEVVRRLLQEPTYANHPLRAQITPPPPTPNAGRMLDPVSSIAAPIVRAGSDYVAGELQRGGAALVQQAKDFRDDARLHGVGPAALRVGGLLAHGVLDPMATFGSLLGSPEDEMAGTPDSERKTGLLAYNRETDRLAARAATNVRNNTPGEMQDVAGEEAAQSVRDRRRREAILSPIQTAANYVAPGIFKATERAALPIAERALGKIAGKIASRLSGEGAAGAAFNVASDPTHPISASVTGAGAGVVLGETGHLAGRGATTTFKAGLEGTRQAGKAIEALVDKLPQSKAGKLTDQLSTSEERRATAERDANHDALTGAPNVRAYQAALKTAEADPNTSIVRFDVNGFKGVNDAHGHAVGDQALVQVPASLTRAAADVGIPERVFRVGGDEFAAIVPKDKAEAFRNRAEELYGVRDHGNGVRTSISGGVGDTNALADQAATTRKFQQKATQGIAGRQSDTYTPGQVNIERVPVSDINLDPSRFQYKQGTDAETGAGSELKGLSKFDEQLAGVVSVWRDPVDGKLYAVNGHNRIALAKRTSHESVNVQMLPAKTANEARAMGALANIAEGRGTALDAAQFFRNSGLGVNDLADRVSFKGQIANQGLGLSKLAPDLFSKVEIGQLPESHGAVIGDELVSSEMQRTAVQAIESSGKRLNDGEVREVARQVAQAGNEQVKQSSLFGTEQVEHPLYVEKAQLASLVKSKLSGDRRLFGYVAKEGRAEGLARAGNVIDVEGSKRIAQESAQLEEVFNQLYTRSGPIADALTQAARRVANGEKPRELVEGLYPSIRQAVQEALAGRETPGGGAPGIGNLIRELTAGQDAARRQVAGTEEATARAVDEGRALDSTDPNQAGLLSPEDFNAGELRAPRDYREGGTLLSPSEPKPHTGPERLETFAVKTGDGTIIEGRSGHDARMRAARSGLQYDFGGGGFITSTGRFVPEGREAMMLAFHADQLRRNSTIYKTLTEGALPIEVPSFISEKVRGVGGKGVQVAPEPEPFIAARISESGVERRPDTNPYREAHLREQERQAGLPADLNNPEGGPHIVSRALQIPDGKGGTFTHDLEQFSETGRYVGSSSEKAIHATEGYKLSDDSFITREEAKSRFPDADFGPEGRDKSGALFSPEGTDPLKEYRARNPDLTDLFGRREPSPVGEQESLFGSKEGTAESRNLRQTEGHARSEAERLRQVLALETNPAKRAEAAGELADHLRLLNRDGVVSPEEMRVRAIAEVEAESGAPTPGPDQSVLLAPSSQATDLGARLRRALGIKNANTGDVVALRKISTGLADAIGVPLREGRGNLKRLSAEGAFFTKPEVIRVRRLKKLDTVAHEIGHFLSKKYDVKFAAKMLSQPDRAAVFKELVQMGRDLYGTRTPHGGYAEEGVAQWARFFVTEPQRMVTDAPTFTAYMDKLLDREPALRDSLLKARDNWETYEASPADAKIASMVVRTPPSMFAGTSPGMLIDHLFNDMKPIRRAVDRIGGSPLMSENAANLAELTKGNAGRARDVLDNGFIKFNSEGVRVTRGLTQILKEIGEKNREEFTNYLIARQVMTKTAQGIDTGFDVKAATEVVDKAGREHPEWEKSAREIWDFRSAGLRYEADAGLLTQAEVNAIRKGNPTPTPFYRSFEEESGSGGGGRSVQLARNTAGVHRMVGSDRAIIDPLQSIIQDAYTVVDRAQKHYAASVLIKSALSLDGGGHIAQLLPEVPKELRRIDLNRVEDQLVNAGWSPPTEPDAAFALKYLQAFYEKRQAGAREIRDQVLPILIDGKRQWVQINDKSTWQALEGMNVPELGVLERAFAAPTRWLRLGATAANPDFALINPLRDAFPAAIYSSVPLSETHLPGFAFMQGAGHMLTEALHIKGKGDPLAERFAQEGGESSGMVGADIRTMTNDHQRTLHEMTRSLPAAILDQFRHPVKFVASQFQIFENATRLGEFGVVRADRMKRGMPEREASVEGAYAARNATQDFQKQGRLTRYLNRYIPFLGAHLGDIYKLSQEFNPKNLATPEGRARYATVGLRAMAYITIPSVSLYLLQHDDPDYQEIPEYLKSNAWVIIDKENGPIPFKLRSGKEVHVWLIPRPYMLGYIFGYMPEKILAGVKDKDPTAFGDMLKYGANIFTPPWLPTIAAPFIENARNRSQFSGRPIVPRNVEGLAPSEQSAPRTGETARLLGKGMGQSPAQIENIIRGYSGGLGQTLLRGADALLKGGERAVGGTPLSPPATSDRDWWDHTPVAGRFVGSQPTTDAKSVSRAYADYQAAEQKRQTWRSYLKAGDTKRAGEYLAANKAEIASVASSEDTGGQSGALRQVDKALSDITKARREVAASTLPDSAKSEKLHKLGLLERTIARDYYGRRGLLAR